jgi:hypothetical protein
MAKEALKHFSVSACPGLAENATESRILGALPIQLDRNALNLPYRQQEKPT